MSKTSQSISMLKLLYSRGIVSISEIADYLETNPRNVPEYKKELENAGYVIEALPGRYGGYHLLRKGMFPVVGLTMDEKSSFASVCQYLYAKSDFMEGAEFDSAFSKIAAAINLNIEKYQLDAYERMGLSKDKQVLQDTFHAVKRCQKEKLVLYIEYENAHCEISKRNIHCYKMYIYAGQWFVLAYDEWSRDMRYFKINRISKYQIQSQSFRVLLSYKESDYLDEYGMLKNGDWHRVTLLMEGDNASRAKEHNYGKNQHTEVLALDRVQISFDMQNVNNTLPMFVLGLGQECTVLEPQWLKDELVHLIQIIQKKYI